MKCSSRTALLLDADAAITGDRNNQYGPPSQDFQRTAEALTALGFRVRSVSGAPEYVPLEAHHVAIIMGALKLSRLMWSPANRDSWVDLAGYAACGYECVVEERNL